MRFKYLALATTGVCIALVAVWLLAPRALLAFWGVSSAADPLADLMGRRTAALFAGLGLMLYLARDAEPSTARTALSGGFALACLALVFSGVYELWAGHAGVGILAAILVEAALALGFLTARAGGDAE
jgi:hypothetical protein